MNNHLQLAAPVGANPQPVAPAAEPTTDFIFDRYVQDIVGFFYAHLYDSVEVHGVRNLATGIDGHTCYEVDNITPTSFSVYVHLKGGGVDCVGDFSRYADAAQYGVEVGGEYGWPVRNYVLEQHRTTTLIKLQ